MPGRRAHREALAAVADELGDAVVTLRCDVTVEGDLALLTDTAVERFGGLHIAFANAGTATVGTVVDLDIAEWTRVLDVNLTGPMLTIKHAARRMERGGSIIATASLNAVQAGNGMGAYCVSKAGVAMLVEVAAIELGPAGIRVNAVGPGLVATTLTQGAFAIPGVVEEYEETRRGPPRQPRRCQLVAFSPPTRPASSPGRCTWPTAGDTKLPRRAGPPGRLGRPSATARPPTEHGVAPPSAPAAAPTTPPPDARSVADLVDCDLTPGASFVPACPTTRSTAAARGRHRLHAEAPWPG